MENKKMELHQDEKDDLEKIILNNRFDPKDFDISSKDISKQNDEGTFITNYEINIKRISNGASKIYLGGHGKEYHSQFDKDLKASFFGEI